MPHHDRVLSGPGPYFGLNSILSARTRPSQTVNCPRTTIVMRTDHPRTDPNQVFRDIPLHRSSPPDWRKTIRSDPDSMFFWEPPHQSVRRRELLPRRDLDRIITRLPHRPALMYRCRSDLPYNGLQCIGCQGRLGLIEGSTRRSTKYRTSEDSLCRVDVSRQRGNGDLLAGGLGR